MKSGSGLLPPPPGGVNKLPPPPTSAENLANSGLSPTHSRPANSVPKSAAAGAGGDDKSDITNWTDYTSAR